ncbi:NAD-dependent epimerase/dehydratase family protein [Ferrovibrio sp. MS7]|uniref:NAD-dependent epimerase/dehydratase family protein n=1 Tax=Ferrovibrio plantarum TaxID=3119164 RepID=UPI0031358E0E
MIVGSGLLAQGFRKYSGRDDIVIFASGVSNSAETDQAAYSREQNLLERHLCGVDRLFVYFSTCSIFDPERQDSRYTRHKLAMEALIAAAAPRHYIFRLPQVVGNIGNPNTLANFLHDKIKAGESFNVWARAPRALLDIEDVCRICSYVIDNEALPSGAMNVFPPFAVTALDIVRAFEVILGRVGKYEVLPLGTPYHVDTTDMAAIMAAAGVEFPSNYFEKILRKYYVRHG